MTLRHQRDEISIARGSRTARRIATFSVGLPKNPAVGVAWGPETMQRPTASRYSPLTGRSASCWAGSWLDVRALPT